MTDDRSRSLSLHPDLDNWLVKRAAEEYTTPGEYLKRLLVNDMRDGKEAAKLASANGDGRRPGRRINQ